MQSFLPRSVVFYVLLLASFNAIGNAVADENDGDLRYLLTADPNKVSRVDLDRRAEFLEDRHHIYHQVEGISWPALWEEGETNPSHYNNGGDTALYTGYYLAAAAFRFAVTHQEVDLDKVLMYTRGIYILTHVSPIPGVIARNAFPTSMNEQFYYPGAWQGRIDDGLVYESADNIPDPLNPGQFLPQMTFYTNTSRDQVTGVLFGLSVAWQLLSPAKLVISPELQPKVAKAREIVATITHDIYNRLRHTGGSLKDHSGGKGKLGADKVDRLLELQLLALYRSVVKETASRKRYKRVHEKYLDQFKTVYMLNQGNPADWFNRWANLNQYYSWSLRFARAYAVHLLEDNWERKRVIHENMRDSMWKHVDNHQSTFFTFLHNAVRGTKYERMQEALYSLKAFSLRPNRMWKSPLHDEHEKRMPNQWTLLFGDVSKYVTPAHLREPTAYWIWSRDPFRTGKNDSSGMTESTGVDYLLPYWIGRYYGYLPQM